MNHCAKCGAELEPNVEPAVCPACLLEAGLSDSAEAATCEVCGTRLPATAPGAPCPACLVCGAINPNAVAGSCEDPQSDPDASPIGPREAELATKVTVPAEQNLGLVIGRYKLLEKLGEGGFGTVYVAEQRKPVKRRVALKIIKLGMDTKQVIARFEAERQALALMDHPNIAKVFDAGATDTGRSYFVMELVHGIKITDYCDQNDLSTRERLELFISVCQAIQHAHQKGIIHRDIKPSNILVTLHDGVPVPKVIDFGIAKATQGELTEQTVYTRYQEFIGTPAYMSPEQAEMSGLDIDTRADIYSLGVLLYELLTGKTPFDAKELLEAGLEQMRRTIREREPLKPSTRLSQLVTSNAKSGKRKAEKDQTSSRQLLQMRKLIELLRGDLDWIVMKCLEKDRARRYATANALASDVQRHLNTEPVAARPPSQSYRLQKWIRRNKLAFAAATTVTLALVLGIVASTWQAVRATRAEREQIRLRQAAQEAQVNESQQRQRAENEALTNRQNLYAADMNLAAQALENSNLPRARELLEKYRPPPGAPSTSPLHADLRGWEWRYLMGQCRSDEIATLGQLPSRVFTVAISSNGQWLAAACGDGTVPVWDLRTQRQVTTFEVFRGAASFAWDDRTIAATFSPDSRILAAGGTNRDIFLWNVETHAKLATLTGHNNTIGHLAFSPDGSLLASASYDGSARLWDLRSQPPTALAKIEPGFNTVFCVTFSPDGKALATSGNVKPVKIWDISDPAQPRLIGTLDAEWTEYAAFCPDGKRLAICETLTSSIRVWEFPSLRELAPLRGQSGQHMWLAYSPDGRQLAAAGANLCIGLWDLDSYQVLRKLKGHEANTSSLAFALDGQTLVSGGFDGTVRLWDASGKSRAVPGFQVQSWIHTLAISRDSKYAAVMTGSDHLILWDIEARRELAARDFANSYDGQIEFAPDGKRVCVTSASVARWFEIPSLKLLGEEPANRLVFAADGRFAMLARAGQIVRRDFPSGLETVLDSQSIGSTCSALSPDGELFVIAGGDGKMAMWNTRRPGPSIVLMGHKMVLFGVAWSPDGKLLASACWDGQVGLWDRAGRLIQFLRGHSGPVWNVAFSRDGRTLASSGDDGTIRLWNLASLQEAAALHGHEGPVSGLTFSWDGKHLVSGGARAVRFWSAPTFEEVAMVGSREERKP
jgi:eukaryotic-like serine/threonine-protein kinase